MELTCHGTKRKRYKTGIYTKKRKDIKGILLRIPKLMAKDLKQVAKQEKLSVNDLIAKTLEEMLIDKEGR